jgi:hypothetical protein
MKKSWNSAQLASLIFIAVFFFCSCNTQNSTSLSSAATKDEISSTTAQASNNSLSIPVKKIPGQPPASEILAASKQLILKNSQDVKINSLKNVKIAQDGKGRWWIFATAVPAASNVDSAVIIMRKDENKWILVDLGTGVEIDRLGVPKEVLDKWLL